MIHLIREDIMRLTRSDLEGADHILTDPPYDPHVHKSARSNAGDKIVSREFGFAHLTPETRAHVCELAGATRGWTIVFSDLEGCTAWRDDAKAARLSYVRTVPWIRWSSPQFTGDRPPSGAEGVLHFGEADPDGPEDAALVHLARKSKKVWYGPGGLTHYSRTCLRQNKQGMPEKHKAEKPVDLMLDQVSWFTQPGECVVDLFAGHGTTLLACEILGRDAVGFERDEDTIRQGRLRLLKPLQGRDAERDISRVELWIQSTLDEVAKVPKPRTKFEENAYKKAQHRKADALRAARYLEELP